MLSPFRRFLKRFHPEGIPFPGTVFYNWVSAKDIFQNHYERVAEDVAKFCPSGDLLDIGTGPGWLLLRIQNKLPAMRLTGLDISPSMVDKARSNMVEAGQEKAIEIIEGGAADLPFPASSFDCVVSTGSIHHWKDNPASLNEIHRILRPGGCALLYDLVSNTPPPVLREARREFGHLNILLLWLHAFEEPFHTVKDFGNLAEGTAFENSAHDFVGVMCRIVLKR